MHHKNSQNSDSGNAGFNFFGLFGGNGGIESTEANDETKHSNQDAETVNRDALSFDDFNKVIKKENINFKWTGMNFEPKDLTLFRLNTRNLNISNEIYFKRVVVTEYQTTQKIEIKAGSPSGFFESYIDPNLRYSFQSKKLSFIDAEKHCFGMNGHLVTVNSMFENMFLIEEATSAYNNSTSQPQSTFDSNCGAALLRGGKWISDNCDKVKPFVCEFKEASIPFEPQPIQTICPESWQFYNKTRYCYKAIEAKTTWSNAEMLCVREHAHLASVHNYDENLFIACKRFLTT
uniref:C-type lectin domain-containing protein n=1 Tax=Panagrolaimus davidi TaxID=227884 RepID=A0A914Q701_9BILA